VKEFLTPEGVSLTFELPPVGDRLAAFLLDAMIIAAAMLVVAGSCLVIGLVGAVSAAMSVFLLSLFFIRNFYFTWFELRRNGTTPGKRRMGLRVIDARGGPLQAEAVFVRNFMREVEIFLPLGIVFGGGGGMLPGAEGWQVLAAGTWLLVFSLMPLLTADRRRVGDLVGGTIVVREPKVALHRDLAGHVARNAGPREPRRAHVFRKDHLVFYGIFELEALEGVLRTRGRDRKQAMAAVAARIKAKIGWTSRQEDADPETFLRDFYAAQRAHLEQRMLLGERRERKDG
jgi:uncharacterized RDD family membrane protein YckC